MTQAEKLGKIFKTIKKIRFDFPPPVLAAVQLTGLALPLSKKLIANISDGQRQFVLI